MEKKLRKKIQDTVLIDDQLKKTLLNLKEWDENIINLLNQFFEKYWPIEEKIMKDVISKTWSFYSNSIKSIELNVRKEETEEFKKIEEILKSL